MQSVVIGLDAFDPSRFERLSESGKLPHLTKYVELGGYAQLDVSLPPQTEVSWTSIATGLNPGAHGIFDFVHRDPATYTPYVSLLPTERGLLGTKFVPPFEVATIFDEVARQGFSATALWWPATFPARAESLARTIPGLGTPDIHGRLGVGTLLSVDAERGDGLQKTSFEPLEKQEADRYKGRLKGPTVKKVWGSQESALEVAVDVIDDSTVRVKLGDHSVELVEGVWSPILDLSFRAGLLFSVRTLTRVIVTQVRPAVTLYVLPLQIHPLRSPWQYAMPPSFAKGTWKECGPYLTLGWPQDTTGLEEGCITDRQFLALCGHIFETRERILMHHLRTFEEGIIASVFDSLDRIQHMFWYSRPDIVDEWYVQLDGLLGRVERHLEDLGQGEADIFVLSDHGFTDFDYKAHLNRWLIEQGYLKPAEDLGTGNLQDVDWSQSQAYAVGLNSVYLNLEGREGNGVVSPDQKEALLNQIRRDLMHWQGPDERSVVQQAWSVSEVFAGPFTPYGPDLVVGFSTGYRASSETGLGEWGSASIEPNRDHWRADHCVAPQVVPGVLFSNQDISHYAHPSYQDIPSLVIGKELDHSDAPPPPRFRQEGLGDEDQEIVEERLRSLGYL
jgi:predicted AlkP superfamily phosphohydrolase/phosphomutase